MAYECLILEYQGDLLSTKSHNKKNKTIESGLHRFLQEVLVLNKGSLGKGIQLLAMSEN